jgi:hypothetical protein
MLVLALGSIFRRFVVPFAGQTFDQPRHAVTSLRRWFVSGQSPFGFLSNASVSIASWLCLPFDAAGRKSQGGSAMRKAFWGGLGAAILAAAPLSSALADVVADFYRGKNVEMYIGYSAGGGYDVYARLVARHIGKHIPGNPNIIPKNMTGAASSLPTGSTTSPRRTAPSSA